MRVDLWRHFRFRWPPQPLQVRLLVAGVGDAAHELGKALLEGMVGTLNPSCVPIDPVPSIRRCPGSFDLRMHFNDSNDGDGGGISIGLSN